MAGIGTDVDSSLHEMALLWFKQRAGTVIPWPVPLDGMYLANKAKGIHKPAGLEYALSIRQSLNGPYDDSVNTLPDGSWEIRYAQEGSDPAQFTNKGLFACKRDGIPVGVILAVSNTKRNTGLIDSISRMLQQCDVLSINDERRFIIEPRSGTRIELQGDGIEFVLRIDGQVRPFGHVLAQQTIGVLV